MTNKLILLKVTFLCGYCGSKTNRSKVLVDNNIEPTYFIRCSACNHSWKIKSTNHDELTMSISESIPNETMVVSDFLENIGTIGPQPKDKYDKF